MTNSGVPNECDSVGSHLMNGPICDRCGWKSKPSKEQKVEDMARLRKFLEEEEAEDAGAGEVRPNHGLNSELGTPETVSKELEVEIENIRKSYTNWFNRETYDGYGSMSPENFTRNLINLILSKQAEELEKAEEILRTPVIDSAASASDKTVMLAWFADRKRQLRGES